MNNRYRKGITPPLGHGLTFAILMALFLSPALAEESVAGDKTASPSSQDCYLCSLLDTPRDFLSQNFINLSDRLDMFFSNTESFERLNKSYAEFSMNAVAQDALMPNYYTNTRVSLAMPRTQHRLNVMFQTESNGELDSDNPDITPSSPDQQTTALALRGEIHQSLNWKFYADIGSENRGTTLDPFLRFTYYQQFKGKIWNWTWREAFFRFGIRGNGITSRLEFNRSVAVKDHIRFYNQLVWYQSDDYYDRTHSLNYYQDLENHNGAAYSIGQYTTNNPDDAVYYLQFKYKRLIHKTWLFYELIPEVLYRQSNQYAPTPRFTLKLDIMFGKN